MVAAVYYCRLLQVRFLYKNVTKLFICFYDLLRSEVHVDEQIQYLTTLEKSIQSKSKTELYFGLFNSEVFRYLTLFHIITKFANIMKGVVSF